MELLMKKLQDCQARYVIIGGQAMLQQGMPRFTMDWDLFIPAKDPDNFARINLALADELDMELTPLNSKTGEGFVQTFQTSRGLIQFHQAVPGLPRFDLVEARALKADYSGVAVPYLCLEDLLSAKLAAARPKDEEDIIFLKEKKQAMNNRPKKQ